MPTTMLTDYTILSGILNMGIDCTEKVIPIEDGSLTIINDGSCYVDFENKKRIRISDVRTYKTKTEFDNSSIKLRNDCLYLVLEEEAIYIYKDGKKKKLYENTAKIDDIEAKLATKADKNHTHTASDITDSIPATKLSGTINIDNLPKSVIERLVIVADNNAKLQLTKENVQNGDSVKVTSEGKLYFVKDDTKLNSEDGYEEYVVGSAGSVPWSGVQNIPDDVKNLTQKLTEINNNIQDIEDGLGTTDDTLGSITLRVESVESQTNTNKNDITQLKSDVSTLQTDVSNIESELSGVDEELSSINGDIADIQQEADNHAKKVASLSDIGHVKLYTKGNNNTTNISGLSVNNDGSLMVYVVDSYGLTRSGDGKVIVSAATDEEIDAKTNSYKPIVPSHLGHLLESTQFTGTPTAPTAEKDTNTDQIATTKFVHDAITEVKNEISTEGGNISDLQEQVQSIEDSLGTYDTQLGTLTKSIEDVGKQVSNMESELGTVDSTLSTYKTDIDNLKKSETYSGTPVQIGTWFTNQKVMRLGLQLTITSTSSSGSNKTLNITNGGSKTITLTKNDNGYSATIASFVSAQTSSSISIPIGKLLHWRIIIYRSINAVEGILSTNMTDIVFDTELIDIICTSSSGASIYGFLEYISS